jgi:cbb3-type cytochrome c oxidase subunit III
MNKPNPKSDPDPQDVRFRNRRIGCFACGVERASRCTRTLRVSHFRRCLLPSLLFFLVLGAVGCRRDMFQQPFSKPLESSDFFRDNHMASRPVVAHTVARGHLDEDEALYTGKLGTNLVTTFPFPITRETLQRGQERFDIYCAPCHGRTGEGNGIVVQRGFPPPPSYHIDRLRQAPVGHFVDVITHGYGVMYSYATRVKPVDRWAIAAYIRALQKSQDATLALAPPEWQTRLQEEK